VLGSLMNERKTDEILNVAIFTDFERIEMFTVLDNT
jgi:hypothetical protein